MRADAVTVVYATLDLPDAKLALLSQHLSEDEHARAQRFAFDVDRRRFVAARGLLRELLGQRLGVAPERLAFRYGRRGKPALEGDGFRFNVSHSHGRAAYVFSESRDVGIDLERIRPVERLTRIAERVLSPAEYRAMAALSGAEQEAAFFRAWTRREAYGKATGEGLSSGAEPEDGWTLRSLEPAPGFAAAVAVSGSGWRLQEGPWRDEGVQNER